MKDDGNSRQVEQEMVSLVSSGKYMESSDGLGASMNRKRVQT